MRSICRMWNYDPSASVNDPSASYPSASVNS